MFFVFCVSPGNAKLKNYAMDFCIFNHDESFLFAKRNEGMKKLLILHKFKKVFLLCFCGRLLRSDWEKFCFQIRIACLLAAAQVKERMICF